MPSISIRPRSENSTEPVSLASSQVKRVAVIGGGASGAVVLDSLLKENHFDSITLFERRTQLGGVWCLDRDTISTPNHIIRAGYTHVKTDPQLPNPFGPSDSSTESQLSNHGPSDSSTDTQLPNHGPSDSNSENARKLPAGAIVTPKVTQERFEKTPSYHNIKTNIIEKMMTYTDVNKWNVPGEDDPEKTKYVNGLVVQNYINDYIKRNEVHEKVNVVYGTTLEDVERIARPAGSEDDQLLPYQFRLTLRQSLNDKEDVWFQQTFDSIVVTVGHYHVPFIPYVPGLDKVQAQFPSVVQHAKFFRDAKPYQDKTVVVVGSRASGADLSKFIADTATNVIQSIRNFKGNLRLSSKPNVTYKPVITKYEIIDDENFKVLFDDGSEVTNPDNVIYGTGYQFSFPFLNRLFKQDQAELTKQGIIIPNLYQHTFLTHEPLISFVGVPIDGVSFRVFEYQAVLVARYLTGKVALPSREQQRAWISQRLKDKGVTRAYHTIGVDDAYTYLNGLAHLGETKVVTGRPFPILTTEDLATYRAAGEKLRQFWDER